MSLAQFSTAIFSRTATWVFRVSAAASVVLFTAFVYPSLDVVIAPGDLEVGFPTFSMPFVIAFVLCFLAAALVIGGRVAVVLMELYGSRSNGT
jgi:urea transporter